ncbi:uncharacterized protein LOC114956868 isoform X1 [Acropora millepora]|uniref:uncharacterized protein LOC114956868 isoform X1 n=1 Tax=Acropora millepora TaxID=45264 RepID=UPI001CF41D4E|nr:uncharacterized protein LOC114956868 isoform X1 [Acropora millepora]
MARGEKCRDEEGNSPDLDQYTKDALNQLFNKEQQTYDEFLQCFTFLTKEDVIKQKSHSPPIIVPQIGEKDKKKESDVAVSTMSTKESQPLKNENHFIDGNDLPEEVLEPGSTSGSILMQGPRQPWTKQSMLQVDNFVDFEDETSDNEDRTRTEVDAILEDDFLCGNYLPSVASKSLSKPTSNHNSSGCTKTEDLEDCNPDFSKEELEAKEICYLSEGVFNLPGEVDEWGSHVEQVHDHSAKESAKPNLRQLQISTRTNHSSQEGDSHLMESQDADEVTTFQLDTEFDYDNVSLTPKYSFPIKNLNSLELQ